MGGASPAPSFAAPVDSGLRGERSGCAGDQSLGAYTLESIDLA